MRILSSRSIVVVEPSTPFGACSVVIMVISSDVVVLLCDVEVEVVIGDAVAAVWLGWKPFAYIGGHCPDNGAMGRVAALEVKVSGYMMGVCG